MFNIKAILFDKDGTLIDFNKSWAGWMLEVLSELSPDNLQQQKKLGHAVGFDMDSGLFSAGSVFVNATRSEIEAAWQKVDPELTRERISAIEAVNNENIEPVPVCDLSMFLNGLRTQGFGTGVATNSTYSPTVVQLQEMGCAHLFDLILGYDSVKTPKPAPDMILAFCDHLGVKPSEVAMVGDSTHDLNAGRAAGVGLNIGVLSGPAKREDIELLADVVLRDITEIPELLN